MVKNIINFNSAKWVVLLWLGCFFVMPVQAENKLLNGPYWHKFTQLKQAGFLFLNDKNEPLESINAQKAYVPASTTKLITALLALEHWGEKYRFKTEFYLLPNPKSAPMLVVKGYGDPFLVSEELQIIAKNIQKILKKHNISELSGIRLDASYYEAGLIMKGTGESDNPYDAIPSAIAANFNSLYVEKRGQQYFSAEPQTPMTPTAKKIAKSIKHFKQTPKGSVQRVNLGSNSELNQRYFAELLTFFLQEQGIVVNGSIDSIANIAQKPVNKLYTHYNSRNLGDVIRPMMKYSTNFIANQLALNLAVEVMGGEATPLKVKQTYQKLLHNKFAWQNFFIEDGAGLSRHNHLTPSQLIDVLQAFKPWKRLLPEVESRVFAKSGTLIGVSTLAGYVKKHNQWLPFALMINQKVPYHFRHDLAKELSNVYAF